MPDLHQGDEADQHRQSSGPGPDHEGVDRDPGGKRRQTMQDDIGHEQARREHGNPARPARQRRNAYRRLLDHALFVPGRS